VVVAKAFGLQAIDLVYIDFRDGDGLLRQSREGAAMGFTGMTPDDILESSV
jgi:citrate lyase subunit beta-like protein